jgi:hypothetical protein
LIVRDVGALQLERRALIVEAIDKLLRRSLH